MKKEDAKDKALAGAELTDAELTDDELDAVAGGEYSYITSKCSVCGKQRYQCKCKPIWLPGI